MATYTGIIRFRNGNGSLDTFIASANELFDAIEAVGMEPVSEAEMEGQCGRLVKEGPAGAGETLYETLGTQEWVGQGFWNAYKHPELGLYVKVFAYDVGISGASKRGVLFSYQVYWSVTDGVPDSPVSIQPIGFGMYSSGDSSVNFLNSAVTLYASKGPDHFWIASESAVIPSVTTNYAVKYSPTGISPVAFGVFANGSAVTLIAPTATFTDFGKICLGITSRAFPVDTDYRCSAMRYWASEGYGLNFNLRGGATAGYLNDSTATATINGIRIAKSRIIIGGETKSPNFGFVSLGAVVDGQPMVLDLDGSGESTYKVAVGFGNCNPAPVCFSQNEGDHALNYPAKMFSVVVAPWNNEP